MIAIRNRKQLPCFGYLENQTFSVSEILKTCEQLNLLDFQKYNDIKFSENSKMAAFVKLNEFSKSQFFTESEVPYLEGEKYKQVYLTEVDPTLDLKDVDESANHSAGRRLSRLDPNGNNYNPLADELNYGFRNKLVVDTFEKILDSFEDKVTRVRLAWLAPQFELKPHIDYDPSYITRLHIPLITNSDCLMHVFKEGQQKSAHFPADGKVYFLNAGLKHYASNRSDQNRLHLIVDMHGQKCLNSLRVIS